MEYTKVPMTVLTREQVEKIVAHYERLLEKLCIYSDGVDASDLLKCDAALRAENERLKGEIDTLDSLLKDRTGQLAAEHKERVRFQKYHEEGGRVNAELKGQLEAMTKERDEREQLRARHERAELAWLNDAVKKEQQLAAAQARVIELEAQLEKR